MAKASEPDPGSERQKLPTYKQKGCIKPQAIVLFLEFVLEFRSFLTMILRNKDLPNFDGFYLHNYVLFQEK